MGRYRKAMKKLFFILCFLSVIPVAYAGNPAMQQLMGGLSATCAVNYTLDPTSDAGLLIGADTDHDFYGFIFDFDPGICLCEVIPHIRDIAGNPTGKNYYMRIFTMDGNDDATNLPNATSEAVSGAAIVSAGADADTPAFVFTSCVTLTANTPYAFTIFVDVGGDLTDDPEADAVNYWTWAYKNESGADSVYLGRVAFTWDSEIPYEDVFGIDAEDEPEVEVWTQ